MEVRFGQHPDAETYLSQPGLGAITGARVLGEFGDDPCRYASAKARRNYAGTRRSLAPLARRRSSSPGPRNDRLIDALMIQAFAALRVSPGARAFYHARRAKGLEHNDALRRLASRLVGILHDCLKTRTCYDEATAWGHRENTAQSDRRLTSTLLGCLGAQDMRRHLARPVVLGNWLGGVPPVSGAEYTLDSITPGMPGKVTVSAPVSLLCPMSLAGRRFISVKFSVRAGSRWPARCRSAPRGA